MWHILMLPFRDSYCNHGEMVTKVSLDKKRYAEAKATYPTTIILNATEKKKKIFCPS